jgi:hypothetical protein
MRRIMLFVFLLVSACNTFANIPPVPEMYKLVASEQRVPAKLFYAIVLNESRSSLKLDSGKAVLPWPWTINHRGKSHYFQTRRGAFEFASSLIKQKDHRFDIGLGQLNWRWHKDKFVNHWDALDPYKNLTVAAKYLREQYNNPECGSWERAIGCYHRSRQEPSDIKIANNYARRVIRLWKKI